MNAQQALEGVFAHGNRFRYVPGQPYRTDANWFRMADGSVLSVVAGWGTYCSPRPDRFGGGAPEEYEGPYSEVEVWFPGEDEPTGGVPVEDVRAWASEHGGVVAVQERP